MTRPLPRRGLELLVLVCLFWAGGCALLPGKGGPAPAELRLRDGLDALEGGRFEEAESSLAALASRCEHGERGRTAVLLLTASALDPRNPQADPDRAAALSASYLRLPGSSEEDVALARSLYLAALEMGAAPLEKDGSEGSREVPAVASRFLHCDDDGVVERLRSLPAPPGATLADRLDDAAGRADSLAARLQEVDGEREGLQSRVEELEAELERIRKLLQGGGGVRRR